ncbi:MAG: conjugal transfer protein TrbI [Treponema sp.]|nr:conjugal transfer protein TrbI [Treponema sp.]
MNENEIENQTDMPSDDEMILEDDLMEELAGELGEEDELPPPNDENEARILNTGTIIGVIMVGVLVIFLIAFVAMNAGGRKKKQKDNAELDKAGTKTVIEFKDKLPVEFLSNNADSEKTDAMEKTEKEIDDVLDSLPPEFQLPQQGEVGTAPVSSVGSKNSYKSERPDTRNSKSPRKIEGLAALDYSNQQQNGNIVSQIMSGNYGYGANGQRLSKEEFIAQQMAQTQNLQNSLYGNGTFGNGIASTGSTTPAANAYDTNRENFFNSGAGSTGGKYLSKASLWDGTIISGTLVTAINTDNPGVVIARITENVYSSQDHSFLLIPEGSLLMATYNSSVSYGQKDVQVAWNLLIRPDNYRAQLGNMNGVNAQGASGYRGSVSNHPFETLKALGMIAMFSIIQTEISNDINSQNNEYLKNSMTDVYAEASKMGNKILNKALDIKPTIKIKEGTEIKLITNTPLELPPVEIPAAQERYVRTR